MYKEKTVELFSFCIQGIVMQCIENKFGFFMLMIFKKNFATLKVLSAELIYTLPAVPC